MNKNWKNENFKNALNNSVNGIIYAFKNERNLKIQSCFAIAVICVGTILHVSAIKFAILLLCIGSVLFAEMTNTTFENVLDLYSTDYNEKIKLAKDISSGAVLLVSTVSAIIGLIILLPEIINFINI